MRHLAVAGLLTATVTLAGCGGQEAAPPVSAQQDCSGGYVNLSYDDGPTSVSAELADELEAAGLTATFFLLGHKVVDSPEVAEHVAARHQIGNHSYDHPHLGELSGQALANEIADTTKVIEEHTGQTPQFFRPPYGETSATIRETVESHAMTETIWTLDTLDWKGKTAEEILTVIDEADDGDIVLMHDDAASDVEAVPMIAASLAERSLCTAPLRASDRPVEAWEGLSFNAEVDRP